MKFTTILGFTAATTFQLASANVHSACWCEVSGTLNTTYTNSACKAYPTDSVFDADTETPIADPSTVSIHISNTTTFCTSFNASSKAEVPYLGGKEFSASCLMAAPAGTDVVSECN